LIFLFITGAVFLPRWDPRVMTGGVSVYVTRFTSAADPAALFRQVTTSRRLLFYREGINSTVAVERTERMTALRVGGKVDASNGMDMATQLMLGHLPLLLHPRAERVLVIGLGSGVTAGAVAQHPVVREIDVVELEPAVVGASDFFVEENRNVLRDPRVRLVIGDGRNFILAGEKRYDVISSEPSNPWMAGVANLFSREFYRLARERLADDGIMVQWVHGYSLFPRELKMIVNTFRQTFPHATLWRTLRGDYLLVGMNSPLTLDYSVLERKIAASAAVREDLASLRLASPVDLLTLFLLNEADLARFATGAPENTDDRPLLEFGAPLALYAYTTDENDRLLRQGRTREFPPVTNLPPGLLDARRVHFARVYWAGGEKEEALDQLRKAPPPAPADIAPQLERAKLLFSLGEVGQATEKLASLARVRPQDRLITSYLKAGTIVRQLKAEEAVAQHGRTRLGDPNPAEAHNNLGVFYTRLGIRLREPAFFDLAVDALEEALQIEPQAYAVLNNLGNAHFELGRLEEAARAYQRVITMDPNLAQTHFNLGLVYERQGSLDLAAREYRAALKLEPGWHLPRLNLQRLQARATSLK
jgi:spermidine synthase